MTLERLAAADLARAVTTYRDLLRSHQEVVNRLNVFPVPDGDTGTNMALTLEAVVAELPPPPIDESVEAMAATCRAISHGSLMGARGNSGVILSQVLRGVANGCKDARDVGAHEVAAALVSASEAAYGAVQRPIEGTILTVVRAVSEAGAKAAAAGASLRGVFEDARSAGAEALERTPDLLPVLKRAGVVDAGGAGFMLLLDALLHVADGRPLPEPPPLPDRPDLSRDGESAEDTRYEVMYLLEAEDEAVPAFREVWAGMGDSIVVVGGEGIWNCHIHTDDVGAAIEAALDCGRPRNIRVTDLHEQVEEERWVREATSTFTDDEVVGPPVPTAAVAVATGDGIRRIFRSLGVHQLIAGGQSMNPSTAQILEAVESAPADEVVVLPNNKNIVAVAEQVHELTDKKVSVVPTTSVAEGFAALLAYDPEANAEENAAVMLDAACRVVSGEVTRAVRSTDTSAGPVKEGDWLGIGPGGIAAVDETVAGAGCALLDALVADGHEIVTIIEGDGSSAADTRRLTEWLAENRPRVSAEVHHGGQPLYPYLVSVE